MAYHHSLQGSLSVAMIAETVEVTEAEAAEARTPHVQENVDHQNHRSDDIKLFVRVDFMLNMSKYLE